MMTKMSTPIWQRVICGVLSVAGAVALVANVLVGSVHGIWGIAVWVFGVFGAVTFGRIAVQNSYRVPWRGCYASSVFSSRSFS